MNSQHPGPIEDHDRGLAHDLETIRVLNRRRALGLFGAAGTAALLSGCGGGSSGSSSTSSTPTPTATTTATPTPTPTATSTSSSGTSGSCVAYASETNGPYPADGTNQSNGTTSNVLTIQAFQREDIRSSVIGSTTVADGVELTITITLTDVNNSCAPLAGYAVYMWHCNAAGQYSLYDLPSEDYLRGIQVSDANGQVTFTTIVPGCYAGRYPHIHFEVFSSLANATGGRYALLVSQFAMDGTACQTIYTDSRYGNSLARFNQTSINSDNVFGDNSSAQKTAMTLEMSGSIAAGYTGSATVGIAT